MPLYEYRCRECDHLEEVLQKVSDPAPANCPSCGKEHTLEKEVSLTSFQLKGGGWYKDLYSSVPADKSGKADSKESSTSSSTSSSKDSSATATSAASSTSSATPTASPSATSTSTSKSSSSSGKTEAA